LPEHPKQATSVNARASRLGFRIPFAASFELYDTESAKSNCTSLILPAQRKHKAMASIHPEGELRPASANCDREWLFLIVRSQLRLVACSGRNNPALVVLIELMIWPPAIRTSPSRSRVALWNFRDGVIEGKMHPNPLCAPGPFDQQNAQAFFDGSVFKSLQSDLV